MQVVPIASWLLQLAAQVRTIAVTPAIAATAVAPHRRSRETRPIG